MFNQVKKGEFKFDSGVKNRILEVENAILFLDYLDHFIANV
jgi:hypothetical protein